MNENLQSKYRWLGMAWEKEDYLPASYYKRLLKQYQLHGREDVEMFAKHLDTLEEPGNILELGCGAGRATDIVRKVFPSVRLTLLDLSKTMIASVKGRYSAENTTFICSDTLAYMEECGEDFDFVYSLWSFSHSVHQKMEKLLDARQDCSSIENTLTKFLTRNIRRGGQFYLVHFDSRSDEQKILMRQWARVHPLYADYEQPSHSYKLLTKVLAEMSRQGLLTFDISHVKGDPIIYESLDEALEIFINFHLEGALQGYDKMEEVIADISADVAKFTHPDGRISICPAWYVIEIRVDS